MRDFPGGLVVKTLPSNAGNKGSIPGWGAMSPHVLWPKSKKHKIETITNSIKTLKMVHLKKKKSLKTKVVR